MKAFGLSILPESLEIIHTTHSLEFVWVDVFRTNYSKTKNAIWHKRQKVPKLVKYTNKPVSVHKQNKEKIRRWVHMITSTDELMKSRSFFAIYKIIT